MLKLRKNPKLEIGTIEFISYFGGKREVAKKVLFTHTQKQWKDSDKKYTVEIWKKPDGSLLTVQIIDGVVLQPDAMDSLKKAKARANYLIEVKKLDKKYTW